MGKVFGIDLGTTYSCIAYIDENGKPVVLKNAEGDLTTPSAVFFETQTDVTVGSAAKESAKMYPEQVVTFIKRSIGQPGFSLNLNGIDMKPEEISSYILKKVVKDAEDTLRMEGKLGDDEQIRDVVITCPAYFGVTERDATKAAGVIAGLNVLAIINEPTAAAITYGVTDDSQNKTVLVYDLGGGTFDITMINIKPGEIRVICTGGDHNLGGKDWDDRVLMYLAEQYQSETGTPDSILEDAETLQELSLAAERAKKLLSAKEKAPVAVNYMGERVRVELTREKFDELTEDLLTRTIDLTREMFKEAEKKGFTQNDVSEILLVGGSSKMPQVMSRVKSAFGIETKMFDLNAYGASSKDFDDILNIMLINLEKMFGLKDKDTLKRNLAVVINKVDIPTLEEKIGETAAQQYLAENAKTCKSYMDARDAVCRNFLEEYGAGNFVRTAEAKFKTVRYFTCSALGHNHEGQPYEGKNVVDPVMWLLQQADSSIKAE